MDENGETYAIYRSHARRVTMSAPMAHFVAEAQSTRCRAVLLTRDDAHISTFVVEAFRAIEGRWAVDGATGVRAAWGGPLLATWEQLWSQPPLPSPPSTRDGIVPTIIVETFVGERSDPGRRIGALPDTVVEALGAGSIDRWGLVEPLTHRWSHEEVTHSLRRQMPRSARHLAGTAHGARLSVAVSRTRHGLMHHVRACVPARDPDLAQAAERGDGALAAHPRIRGYLTQVAQRFRLNAAMISVGESEEFHGSWGRRPGPRPVDRPLGVAVGPVAVAQLGLDTRRYPSADVMGPRRAPTVLRLFTGAGSTWEQFQREVTAVSPERVVTAVFGGT
ncbi:DUF6177 family protein [Serinibacter salmoneus]|uniref:Uncharacterized protein n=1 Tax=Serinibacter salmoneus TaxID=556530 RepID=A0A2A9CXX8_9MICO|nr:DUF6177 family protein [Serinibacter salmoneus]PFG19284.1 hypothetical protein ATL40_0842 [Serinibacter salmoneus]